MAKVIGPHDVIAEWKLGFDVGSAIVQIHAAGIQTPAQSVVSLSNAVAHLNRQIDITRSDSQREAWRKNKKVVRAKKVSPAPAAQKRHRRSPAEMAAARAAQALGKGSLQRTLVEQQEESQQSNER